MKNGIWLASFLSLGLCASVSAEAAPQIVYDGASGVTDLTQGSAWIGGVVPGADDVAVFDGRLPATLNLGAETSWKGVVRTNIANQVSFVAPEGGVLRLGSEGMESYSENEDYNRTYFYVDLAAVADQTWSVRKNKSPCPGRRVLGPGAVTLAGTGNFLFYNPVTAPVTISSGVTAFSIDGTTWSPAPTVELNGHLALLPTVGEWAFSDLVAGGVFANTGKFSFGPPDTTTSFPGYTNTIRLAAGDSLKRAGAASSNRGTGSIFVQDANVVADGADVTQNIWWHLRSGSWTQKSGDTALDYAANVGRGSAAGYSLRYARLNLEGGTFTSRRLSVGVGNSDEVPADVRVSGGTYTSTSTTMVNQNWAYGLNLALRSSSGETKTVTGKDQALSDTEYPAGRIEITDGTVATSALVFGNDNDVYGSGYHEMKAAARAALRGGELRLGPGGARTGCCWKPDTTMDASWYDLVLSGGVLKFTSKDADSTVDMRLSNRDGGTSVEVGSGVSNVKISGGIYGDGVFRKTGAGGLALTGANDYTGRTEVVEGKLAVGENLADAIWSADDYMATAAGATATPWATSAGRSGKSWSFQHATSIPGTEGTTPPTVSPAGLNGHPALAFSGSNAAFLTGNADQPFSGSGTFTLSFVFQTEPGFTGCSSAGIRQATQVLGTSIKVDWETDDLRQFGIAFDADGHIGCGLANGTWTDEDGVKHTMDEESLWFTEQTVNDGLPHVLVWSWNSNGVHRTQLDGRAYSLELKPPCGSKIQKTRIVLGVGEQQASKTARFRGLVGDIRMSTAAYGPVRIAELARQLGLKYGIAAFADAKTYADAPAAVTATVPAPTAAWTADSLAQTAGQEVSEWREKDGKGADASSTWTFTTALAEAVLKSQKSYAGRTASPVVASDTVNGHKLVSFNGVDTGLGVTGSKTTPVGGADGLTVAAVVRFTGYGFGGQNCSIRGSAPFLSQGYTPSNNILQWGLGLTGAARLVASGRNGDKTGSARSRRRFLDDGEPHVVVMTYPKKGTTGEKIMLTVDGVVTEGETFAVPNTMQNTRVLLGAGEIDGNARYVPVDVAEFAFWKNQVLTRDEVAALTAELCAKYGIYNDGVSRFAIEGQQRSREVYVHAGAAYGGFAGDDFTVYPGQTIWGDGRTEGWMTLAPGAAVKASTQHALTVGRGVTFQDGARIAAAFDGADALRPVSVTGSVRADGEIVVDLTEADGGKASGGPILTWTGTFVAGDTAFFSVQGKGYDVRVDERNKCLKLVRTSGTMLLVR